MTPLIVAVVCTVLVNLLWLAALARYPLFPLEATITMTVLLTSLATVLTAWCVVDHIDWA